MSTYVLVHGSWHGPWCWEKVVPLLKQAGHQVETPDLTGSSLNEPLREITLETYTRRVCETLDAQTEPVILVGHSFSGIVNTQVAEERPEKIQTLVYLTAYLVQNGESLFQVSQINSDSNSDSLVAPNLVVNKEQGSLAFKEGAPLKDMFYGDCSDEDVARAIPRLVPDALAPQRTPVRITTERFGRVPRVYIECLRDQALTPSFQKRMYTATPCQTILSMQTSHSPYFSAPQELVQHLTSLSFVS